MSSIVSVGIDVGTTTSQVIFSRITIDNTASYFTVPKISVLDKEIIYKSPVHITPLVNESLIDGQELRRLVEHEFAEAGFSKDKIDTGAVIITGEAARKENARTVLENLSDFAGDFVVSTAGPDLESVISGKGSGAFQYSLDNGCSVMNLDIGGGTTNVVLFDSGDMAGRCCFDIGGRQIRIDSRGLITYISPSARLISDSLGIYLKTGDRAEAAVLSRITDAMAQLLAEGIGLIPAGEMLEKIRTMNSSRWICAVRPDRICFSGGVADCMDLHDSDDYHTFGDIGVFLGQSIKRNRYFSEMPCLEARETIRATVVGAGTYTMSLSGSTISFTDGIFPLKNIPVMKMSADAERDVFNGGTELLEKEIHWFLNQSDSSQIILAMKGKRNPDFSELENAGKALLETADSLFQAESAVIVISEEDIAKALGLVMRNMHKNDRSIAVIDSVKVDDGDFLDIGSPLMDGLVVPVVVKTLLFG